jgi:RimJ/RimL family protein N-acetyltransferase
MKAGGCRRQEIKPPLHFSYDKIEASLKRNLPKIAMTVIRRIQIDEADLFKRVRLASLQDAPYAFSSTYDAALRRSDESWREQADLSAQGSDRATFFVFSDATPIGIAALYRLPEHKETGELVQMWIAPEHRGKNIAWDLLDAVFKWASENSFCKVIAEVTIGNARACKFYRKYGFALEEKMMMDDSGSAALVRLVI